MTDVIVIGGGIVGCAIAAHLADAGRSVVLIERTAIAAGASGRNSGVVQHPFDPVMVDLHHQTLELYRAFAGEGAQRGGPSFDLPDQPVGLLMVGHDADRVRRLAASLTASHPALGAIYVAPGDVSRLEPALSEQVAACRLDIGYPVAPDTATRAYAAWAGGLRVDMRIGRPASLWRRADGSVRGVTLEDGTTFAAGDVVVAAGPWSPEIIDPTGSWRPIRSLWGVVVEAALVHPPRHVVEEAETDLEPGTTDEPATHAFSLITAASRDTGRPVSALGSTFLPAEPDPSAEVPRILTRARTYMPGLDRARLGAVRACARPLSLDGRPLIGRVPGVEGLWVAAGHGPWGISTGPAAGPMLVRSMAGDRGAIPDALDPARFGPIPDAARA